VRAERENELTVLVEMNELFENVNYKREKNQAESLDLMVIEHRRKNNEDEPRGVVFKHDLIEENG
jgi:hypothetical protein